MTEKEKLQAELVEVAFQRAMALVTDSLKYLPEGSVAITPLVLGLIDRMLPPTYDHLNTTATGVEILSRLQSEQ